MPSKADLFEEGYVIVPSVVPAELCRAVVRDIDEYVTGGGDAYIGYGGMVEMYHRQSMWDVRQLPAVHAVFAELFGTERLWVSIDRCNYKRPARKFKEADSGLEFIHSEEELDRLGFIHWDANPNQRPRPFDVQGLVALTDTDSDMGGFQCVPEVYKNLDDMLDERPNRKFESANLDVRSYRDLIVRPAMKQGDLLIWDSLLPHGNGVNKSDLARYALYATMFPATNDERLREERTACWAFSLPPSGWAFPGDPREIEHKQARPAALTVLGRKLLGLDPWQAPLD